MASPTRSPKTLPSGKNEASSACQQGVADWAAYVLGQSGLAPARHHALLLSELEAVSQGGVDRLMVLMPPGSAKSTYVSVLFPAWWFMRHPASSVLAASHTAGLAGHFGRQVRNLVLEHGAYLGYGLAADSRAAGSWRTTTRGEYFAAGVRGPITGRRADLAIIDDPIRSQAEADSIGFRDHVWNWYRADLATRLKPKGRIVLVMTRWHEDDLCGRLLAHAGDQWRTLRLPALAEADDPLGRSPGAALWPEWENEDDLNRKRAMIGERAWAALFQQTPRPLQGGLFRVDRISVLDAPPPDEGVVVRAWDLAATTETGSNNPDYTAGVKLQRDAKGRCTILDVVRFRGSPRQVEEAIRATAGLDGREVAIGIPEDPGQAGKAQAAYYISVLGGYRVRAARESGAKATRAGPVASQVEAGNLAIVRANWNHAFLEELRDFPYGAKDDQVDALSRAFAMAIDAPAPMRAVRIPLLSR